MNRKPWHRRRGESAEAFAAFKVYLRMDGRRSIDKVGAALYGSHDGPRKRGRTGCLQRWASRWEWVERARLYDEDRADLAAHNEARLAWEQSLREAVAARPPWWPHESKAAKWHYDRFVAERARKTGLILETIDEIAKRHGLEHLTKAVALATRRGSEDGGPEGDGPRPDGRARAR